MSLPPSLWLEIPLLLFCAVELYALRRSRRRDEDATRDRREASVDRPPGNGERPGAP